MRHKTCGGIFKVILRADRKIVYECEICGKILTVYKSEIATSGNPEKK